MNIGLTLIAQMLAFAGLIWLVATKIWPPLLAAIEERQNKIAAERGFTVREHALYLYVECLKADCPHKSASSAPAR